jgi:excisionase family DNA binding protein
MTHLRIKEVAVRLGVSPMTIHRWATQGLIPFIQFPSGQRRFREEDLLSILRPKRGQQVEKIKQQGEQK